MVATFTTKRNHLILVDNLYVDVKAETLSIIIKLGHLSCKIKGIVCSKLNIDIIAGLNWLRQLKPVINWECSVQTVSKMVLIIKFMLIVGIIG